jgi:hypothetical protein
MTVIGDGTLSSFASRRVSPIKGEMIPNLYPWILAFARMSPWIYPIKERISTA